MSYTTGSRPYIYYKFETSHQCSKSQVRGESCESRTAQLCPELWDTGFDDMMYPKSFGSFNFIPGLCTHVFFKFSYQHQFACRSAALAFMIT